MFKHAYSVSLPILGMGHDKKRSSLQMSPESMLPGHASSFSTASSLSRQPLPVRTYGHVARSPSAPASSYFSNLDGQEEPIVSPDANVHFAYSTTLRRHPTESPLTHHGQGQPSFSSFGSVVISDAPKLWDRIISRVTGRPSSEERMTNGSANGYTPIPQSQQETPSSKFAHFTVEVSACHCYSKI